jgi:hypothetical protein
MRFLQPTVNEHITLFPSAISFSNAMLTASLRGIVCFIAIQLALADTCSLPSGSGVILANRSTHVIHAWRWIIFISILCDVPNPPSNGQTISSISVKHYLKLSSLSLFSVYLFFLNRFIIAIACFKTCFWQTFHEMFIYCNGKAVCPSVCLSQAWRMHKRR